MFKPRITALIDTYNQEAFIEKAITSVLEQDFPSSDMEIIVVDDGSTDRTHEIVKKFQPRVQLLSKKNGGQASAFNTGIAQIRGEIVSFLDGDDWWANDKVNRVSRIFDRYPEAGIVGHGIIETFPDGRSRVESLRCEDHFRVDSEAGALMFRSRKQFLGTSRMSIRSTVLKKIPTVPKSLLFEADEYLFTMAAVLSETVIIPEPLTYYRQHASNLFQVADGDLTKLSRKLQILQSLCAALDEGLRLQYVDRLTRLRIMETIETDAERLRLALYGGFPWDTLRAELNVMRIHNSDASLSQRLFSYARLVPALVLSSRSYYRARNWLVQSSVYPRIRQKFLPIFQPPHVHREEK